jgi:hypothetical protein
VLDDPARIADHVAVDHQHRHAALTRQRLDLGPAGASLGDRDLLEVDPLTLECAGDAAARA